MKKLIALLLTLTLTLVLFGCGNERADAQPDIKDLSKETQTQSEAVAETVVSETVVQNASAPTLPDGAIETEQAIDIALKKAGLTESQVIGLWAEFEYDDDKLIYEVDFSDGKYTYDCDIDAMSGKILYFDKELDD